MFYGYQFFIQLKPVLIAIYNASFYIVKYGLWQKVHRSKFYWSLRVAGQYIVRVNMGGINSATSDVGYQ